MTYDKYLKDHKSWVGIFGFLLFSIEAFLLTVPSSGFLKGYVLIALCVAFFAGTYLEYRKTVKYYRDVEQRMEGLEEKYLIYEMLEDGETQEEKKRKELLYEIERDTVTMVEEFKRDSKEYREYVETWVHEIKIPIAVIKMILANHKEADLGISVEIDRVEKYVEQALFYARSATAEKDYLVNRIGLEKVVQTVIIDRKRQLREMNARVDLHDLDREVISDSKWLQFMIGQIVDNSIKYGEKGSLVLEIYSTAGENAVRLHIKDNGIGIKSTEIDRVFDKGFTGKNGRGGANSTGIGLYLCRNLCKKLEHNITLTSKEGEGTTVTIVFPISSMTEVAAKAEQ